MQKQYCVYILTNHSHGSLYVGVTGGLKRRVYEHMTGKGSSFTRRYNIDQLVYFEVFEDVYEAIQREKRIKGGSRARKMKLVDGVNPDWNDLYDQI